MIRFDRSMVESDEYGKSVLDGWCSDVVGVWWCAMEVLPMSDEGMVEMW